MMHDDSGRAPPMRVPVAVPYSFARRGKAVPVQLAVISTAVRDQGATIDAVALSEETGLPVDAILRFAATMVVSHDMVDLGVVEPEDAIRLGSAALAASIRIVKGQHAGGPTVRTFALPAASAGKMRRVGHAAGQDARLVVPARTSCPRCGARSDAEGGCSHQRVMTADEATGKGLPNAR